MCRCHLSPHFGRAVNPTWESDTVLNIAASFHLNPYLRHHDFFLLRYQVALFEALIGLPNVELSCNPWEPLESVYRSLST